MIILVMIHTYDNKNNNNNHNTDAAPTSLEELRRAPGVSFCCAEDARSVSRDQGLEDRAITRKQSEKLPKC